MSVIVTAPPLGIQSELIDSHRVCADGKREIFFRGLEDVIGPPAMNVMGGMEEEHCGAADSLVPFTTSNGMTTSSHAEFEFVVRTPELRPGWFSR